MGSFFIHLLNLVSFFIFKLYCQDSVSIFYEFEKKNLFSTPFFFESEADFLAKCNLVSSSDVILPVSPYGNEEIIWKSDDFETTLQVCARSYKPGYVFRIILEAKKDSSFDSIGQNYLFLIDRSNSIPRARYYLNRRAVLETLDELQPEDSFNLLIFDGKVTRFSPISLSCSADNLAKAKNFLEAQSHGGVFAATDLYTTLCKILPKSDFPPELTTAILLSDGDTYLSLEMQRQLIGQWTYTNDGKISLFSVTTGTGNNLSLLEFISHFNKGHLLYISKPSEISKEIKELVKSIRFPIAKELNASAICCDPSAFISLQPKNSRLPNLYQSRPIEIWGTINKLTDFTLCLQGVAKGKKICVKKEIQFDKAHFGTIALEKQWAFYAAQEFYEHFFKDGKFSHLDAAKQFLEPHQLKVPFFSKN